MPVSTISNRDDVLDSRDIINRIEELTAERDACSMIREDGTEESDPQGWADQYPEAAAELAALDAFRDEAEQYSADWDYGATLIRDSYFTDYAKELLTDCGDLPKDLPWYVVIDWDATAEHIKSDYAEASFNGVTYWVR